MQHEALAAMEIEQAQQQFTANRHNKSKCWQSTLFFFLIERIYLCCPSDNLSLYWPFVGFAKSWLVIIGHYYWV